MKKVPDKLEINLQNERNYIYYCTLYQKKNVILY